MRGREASQEKSIPDLIQGRIVRNLLNASSSTDCLGPAPIIPDLAAESDGSPTDPSEDIPRRSCPPTGPILPRISSVPCLPMDAALRRREIGCLKAAMMMMSLNKAPDGRPPHRPSRNLLAPTGGTAGISVRVADGHRRRCWRRRRGARTSDRSPPFAQPARRAQPRPALFHVNTGRSEGWCSVIGALP